MPCFRRYRSCEMDSGTVHCPKKLAVMSTGSRKRNLSNCSSVIWLQATSILILTFSSVQLLSHVRHFAMPWTEARQDSQSITNSRSHPNTCPLSQWCHLVISSSVIPFSSCPQPLPASVFSSESTLRMRWPKYWSFSFNISPSNELSGLISFRMDWLDLLAVQGTLKSPLQHHSSKALILWRSAFFTVQLSHPYMTIGKTIALTRWTFVDNNVSAF